jgi:hypothetical protein
MSSQWKDILDELKNEDNCVDLQLDKVLAKVKSGLMFQISGDSKYLSSENKFLIKELKKTGALADAEFKNFYEVRRRVLNFISEKREGFFSAWRKLFLTLGSSFAAFVIFAYAIFVGINFDAPIARATRISEISGNVYVLRNGEKIKAYENMELHERDLISTDRDGQVAIRFLDDSLSRLGEGSTVVMNKLFAHSQSDDFTVVEMELLEGRVWTRALHEDVPAARFAVKSGNTATVAKSGAAFDLLKEKDGDTNIKVVDKQVDVLGNSENDLIPVKTLNEGNLAYVRSNSDSSAELKIDVSDSSNSDEESLRWVEVNLSKDKLYVSQLLADSSEKGLNLRGETDVEEIIENELDQEDIMLKKKLDEKDSEFVGELLEGVMSDLNKAKVVKPNFAPKMEVIVPAVYESNGESLVVEELAKEQELQEQLSSAVYDGNGNRLY